MATTFGGDGRVAPEFATDPEQYPRRVEVSLAAGGGPSGAARFGRLVRRASQVAAVTATAAQRHVGSRAQAAADFLVPPDLRELSAARMQFGTALKSSLGTALGLHARHARHFVVYDRLRANRWIVNDAAAARALLQLPCIVARPGTVAACKSDALFELEVVCHDFDWATSSRALVRVGGRVTTPAIRSLGETDATMYHYPMFEVPPPADDVDETPPPRTADEDEDDASGDESDDDDDDATPRPPEQPRPPRRASRGVVSAVLTLAQAVSYTRPEAVDGEGCVSAADVERIAALLRRLAAASSPVAHYATGGGLVSKLKALLRRRPPAIVAPAPSPDGDGVPPSSKKAPPGEKSDEVQPLCHWGPPPKLFSQDEYADPIVTPPCIISTEVPVGYDNDFEMASHVDVPGAYDPKAAKRKAKAKRKKK